VFLAAGDATQLATIEILDFSAGSLKHLKSLDLPGRHSTMIDIFGDKAFVTTGDNGGLSVIDIADPANATVQMQMALADARYVEALANNEVLLVTGGASAAVTLQMVPEPGQPWPAPHANAKVGGATVGAPTWGTLVDGTAFYVSADEGGVISFTLDQGALDQKQVIPTTGDANGLALTPDRHIAFLANGQEGLQVMDVQDPASAKVLAAFDVQNDAGSANAVAIMHNMVALADGRGGIKLLSYKLDKVGGKTAVILLTMSDGGVPKDLAQKIAKRTVDWVTPNTPSKILLVRDDSHNNEAPGDSQFVLSLLHDAGYIADYLDEPKAGLEASDVADYDVVWFSNPGHPIDDKASFRVLEDFVARGGGVVLQGDDMTWSKQGFSLAALTHLKNKSNGTTFCGKKTDNNKGQRYRVTFAQTNHPITADLTGISFVYGDDIDTSVPLAQGEEVLAWATLDNPPPSCSEKTPVIIAYSPAAQP
jgi:hypothetical protein